jgi:PAS domain S-box-containing protein
MSDAARLYVADQVTNVDFAVEPDSLEDLFQSLFDQSGFCMAHLDARMHILNANSDFQSKFGGRGADLTDRSIFDLLHPGIQGHLRRQCLRFASGRRPRFVERVAAIGPHGMVFYAQMTCVAVRDVMGNLTSMIVLLEPEEVQGGGMSLERKKILTHIDAQILEGVASGESTIRLATKLYLSRQGIEYHVGVMLRKLNARNRASLVARAYATGVLTVGTWPPKVAEEYIK